MGGACRDATSVPRPAWRTRKESYSQHLEEADQAVLCVALADKRHNARCIVNDVTGYGPEVWERFSAVPEDQRWYARTVTAVLVRRRPGHAAQEWIRLVHRLCDLVPEDVGREG